MRPGFKSGTAILEKLLDSCCILSNRYSIVSMKTYFPNGVAGMTIDKKG
jgi:hypothetical protein